MAKEIKLSPLRKLGWFIPTLNRIWSFSILRKLYIHRLGMNPIAFTEQFRVNNSNTFDYLEGIAYIKRTDKMSSFIYHFEITPIGVNYYLQTVNNRERRRTTFFNFILTIAVIILTYLQLKG